MIELSRISKCFNSADRAIKAVDQVTLNIEKNEIFGLIGQSGAGKSTLLRFINGLLLPDEGEVIVAHQVVNQMNEKQLRTFRKNVSMVFQQFNLLNNLTVEQNICLPLKLHRYETSIDVDEVLEQVGLSEKKHHYPSQLSGGQKQRVGIARGLVTKPKIMLLDEPTSALDEQTTQEIANVLKNIHQQYPITMVVVTHQLSLIQSLCHRAGIMEQGKLMDVLSINQNSIRATYENYTEFVQEVLKNA